MEGGRRGAEGAEREVGGGGGRCREEGGGGGGQHSSGGEGEGIRMHIHRTGPPSLYCIGFGLVWAGIAPLLTLRHHHIAKLVARPQRHVHAHPPQHPTPHLGSHCGRVWFSAHPTPHPLPPAPAPHGPNPCPIPAHAPPHPPVAKA